MRETFEKNPDEKDLIVESVGQLPSNSYELTRQDSHDSSVTTSQDLSRSISEQSEASGPRVRFALEVIGALVLILALMGWIQFGGPAILDNDGYYHIRWAAMLRENWPHLPAFKNLPLTTLNEQDYVDHHYLFHILLIPFTFGDLRVGAKLAAVIYSSIGILSMFALLVALRVRLRWLWLAPLIASSEPFLYRFAMTRAPALSLALLGLGTYLILKRKLILIGVLAFAFVWFYSLFPLLLAFTLAQAVAVYTSERRIDLWPVLACALGIVAGLIINPYFPHNLGLLREHLFMKAGSEYSVDVGVEWYPYETLVFLQLCGVALAVQVAGMLAFDFKSRVRDAKPLFFLFVSLMFLLMALKSRRFVEYWPPFAVVFAAFTIGPRLENVNFGWLRQSRDRVIASIVTAAVVVAACVALTTNVVQARIDVKDETDPYAYRGASEWLATHT